MNIKKLKTDTLIQFGTAGKFFCDPIKYEYAVSLNKEEFLKLKELVNRVDTSELPESK